MNRKRILKLIMIQANLTITTTLAGMFSLIFLVKKGFSIQEAMIFNFIDFGAATLVCFLFIMVLRSNPRWTIGASMILLALGYGSFVIFDGYWLLFIPSALFGISLILFWVPYNILILELTEKRNRGFTIGLVFFMTPVISVMTPLLGGTLIEHLNFEIVFIIALIVLIFNTMYALWFAGIRNKILKMRFDFRSMGKRLSLAFLFEGMHEGILVPAIPLLSFGFTGGEFDTGLLFSFFALMGAIAGLVVGRISDKKEKRLLYVKIGVLGTVPGIIIAGMATTIETFIVGMAVLNFFVMMIWMFLLAHLIDRSESRKGDAIVTREVLLNTGRTISSIIGIFLLVYIGLGAVFALSSLFLLGILFVK